MLRIFLFDSCVKSRSRYGLYTEFVSSDALIRNVSKTQAKLSIRNEERPVAIQIYGRETAAMADAARICEEACPDVLDINFGCPVKKVAEKAPEPEC